MPWNFIIFNSDSIQEITFQEYLKDFPDDLITPYQTIINFLTFPACFWIPIIFSNLNYNCSNLLDMRNLQEQVKKAFCYQKLIWPFTVWINCSSDRKKFANFWPSASNFKSFSLSLEHTILVTKYNYFLFSFLFVGVSKRYGIEALVLAPQISFCRCNHVNHYLL